MEMMKDQDIKAPPISSHDEWLGDYTLDVVGLGPPEKGQESTLSLT